MTDDEKTDPAHAPPEPGPRVFEFSREEVADILLAHIERHALLPVGTYHLQLEATPAGFRLECTPLPNVHVLPSKKR